MSKLTAGDFLPHVGVSFDLTIPNGETQPLRLASVAPQAPDDVRFTLNFVGAPGRVLPQAIYSIDHPALGAIGIFLVPSGPEPGGVGYHAVFS